MSFLTLGWSEHPPTEYTHGAVSIGNFDGVHRGHQALLQRTRAWADRIAGPAIAVTFDPPPVALLNPAALREPLTTIAERSRLLLQAGMDRVIILRTDASLLALSAEAFFEDLLVRQWQVKAIVEGYNFHFGHSRRGSGSLLKHLCDSSGIGFEEMPSFNLGEQVVSSSLVRQAIEAGDLSTATELLGRGYTLTGKVESGARRGRTLGFPTANLGEVATLLPKLGVYAVVAEVDGREIAAVANVGPNPTFGEEARKIEVHLLDFQGDLYGRELRVEFVDRIREVRTFSGVDELKQQIDRDIVVGRQILSRRIALRAG